MLPDEKQQGRKEIAKDIKKLREEGVTIMKKVVGFGDFLVRLSPPGYLKFIHSLNPEEEEFIIPVSLSSLAEYLHVDRASMMRTLQLMKRDGLIESKARKFRLLDASPQIFVQETDHGIPSKESRKSEGAFIHAYKH